MPLTMEEIFNLAVTDTETELEPVATLDVKNFISVICFVYILGPGSANSATVNGRPNPLPATNVGTRPHQPFGGCGTPPSK